MSFWPGTLEEGDAVVNVERRDGDVVFVLRITDKDGTHRLEFSNLDALHHACDRVAGLTGEHRELLLKLQRILVKRSFSSQEANDGEDQQMAGVL